MLGFEGNECDAAVCVPAVEMFEQALFAACSAATDAMALVARPLQVIVAKQMRGAATATADLMGFMRHRRTDGRNVAALAGVVWQYCTNIAAMKLDDKEIVVQQIKLWMEQVKDAMTELSEVVVASESDDEDEDEDDDDDEDDEDEQESLTEEELQVRPPVLDLCRVTMFMLRKAADVLQRLPAAATHTELAANDELLDLCDSLCLPCFFFLF